WVVSGYAEVMQALRDRRLSGRATADEEHEDVRDGKAQRLSMLQALFVDPVVHARLRKGLQPLFGPRATERRRETVSAIVSELLDAVEPAGRLEVMSQLALPLIRQVLLDLLGVPADERDHVWQWLSAISPLLISVHGANAT